MHSPTSQDTLPSSPNVLLQLQTVIPSMQDVRRRMQFSVECVYESTAQRSLTSTWVFDEVRLAIQKGYQVLDIMEM